MLSQRLSLYCPLNPGAPAGAEAVFDRVLLQFKEAQEFLQSAETANQYEEFLGALAGDQFADVLEKGTAFLYAMESHVLSLELESRTEVNRLRTVRQWVTVVITVVVCALILLGWLFIREQGKLLRAEQRMIQYLFHEIRNPLNHVVNGIESMLLETPGLDHATLEHLKSCMRGGELITGLLDDVLNIAKLESGVPLNLTRTCLAELCSNAVRISALSATSRGTRCLFVPGEGTGGYYMADSTRLSQVLINLLSNSVKYVGDGGLVRLRMNVVKRTGHSHEIAFSVEDNGPGVSSAEQAAMFTKFQTFHKSSGTGLGLYLTSVIIGRMGSKIRVSSPPESPDMEHGTAFSFTVSLKEAVSTCGSSSAILASPLSTSLLKPRSPIVMAEGRYRGDERKGIPATAIQSLRVLVVDDESINVRILVRKLTREPIGALGWTIDTASSLPECLEKTTQGLPYDVLFLDECFRGSEVTGSGYISTLRSRGVRATVFMCSANCSKSDESRYRKLGAAGVFPKPVPDGATLLATVSQSLHVNSTPFGDVTDPRVSPALFR